MADRLFEGEEAILHVIERIVAPLGLRVDATSPWVDARLPDGSRVHAIIPPLWLRVRPFRSGGPPHEEVLRVPILGLPADQRPPSSVVAR